MSDVSRAQALAAIDLRIRELTRQVQSLRRDLPLQVGSHEGALELDGGARRGIEHVLGLYEYRRARILEQSGERVRLTARCAAQTAPHGIQLDQLL